MTVFVLASVSGSPGASRLAIGLAAAWAVPTHRRVVFEADPDGGRLGAELGVGVEPGLMALALTSRAAAVSSNELIERGAASVADWFLVPAPPSSEQAYSALVHAASSLAAAMELEPDGVAWFVDAGRLSGRSPALAFAKVASSVLLVTRGSFADLQLVAHRVDALRNVGCHVEVVVVEPTAWSAREIAQFVGGDVAAVLPHVRSAGRGVAAMRSSSWRPWWKVVDELAAYLAADTPEPESVDLHVLADEVASP